MTKYILMSEDTNKEVGATNSGMHFLHVPLKKEEVYKATCPDVNPNIDCRSCVKYSKEDNIRTAIVANKDLSNAIKLVLNDKAKNYGETCHFRETYETITDFLGSCEHGKQYYIIIIDGDKINAAELKLEHSKRTVSIARLEYGAPSTF